MPGKKIDPSKYIANLYIITSGTWRNKTFKPYNFTALGANTPSGALHPLNKVRHEFRNIFFEMGFTEMPTNRFVFI